MIKNRNINHICMYYLYMIVNLLMNLIMNTCIYIWAFTHLENYEHSQRCIHLTLQWSLLFITSYYIFIVFYSLSSTWHTLLNLILTEMLFWLGQVVLSPWYKWKNRTSKRSIELPNFIWMINRSVRNRSSYPLKPDPVH